MHRLSRHSPAITAISCLMAMVWMPAAQGIHAAQAPETVRAVTWIGRLLAIPAAPFHASAKRRGAGATGNSANRHSNRLLPHTLNLWAVASIHVLYAWQHGCPARTIKTGVKLPSLCTIESLSAAYAPRSPHVGFLRVLAARPPPCIL